MLYLSASSISDYYECGKRFWYRTNMPEAKVESDAMISGSIIHEAIERFDNLKEAEEWAYDSWNDKTKATFADGIKRKPKNFHDLLNIYYNKVVPQLVNGETQKEYFFKLPYNKLSGVTILGKIDRLTYTSEGPVVYDWKTAYYPPDQSTLQSLQFYVYDWAVKQLTGEDSKVIYGHLSSGTLYEVELKDSLKENLLNVIDQMIYEVLEMPHKQDNRIVGYHCKGCPFQLVCFSQVD